jgi:phosphohistidine phosphatase SixA
MKILSFLIYFISVIGFCQTGEEQKATTVYLVRHAEKADDGTRNPPLSDDGIKRAQKLSEMLSTSGVTAIYSTDYKRTKSTVEPLAKANNIVIKLYEPMKEDELKRIIEDNRGGVVVICGHSNTTPWSANFLAGTKLDGFKESDYGNLLIVTLWDFGKASLTRVSY